MPTDICNKKRKTDGNATPSTATEDSKLHQEIDRLKKENAKLLQKCNNCDTCVARTCVQDTDDIIHEKWEKVVKIYVAGGGPDMEFLYKMKKMVETHCVRMREYISKEEHA
jgi:hypothetical protein